MTYRLSELVEAMERNDADAVGRFLAGVTLESLVLDMDKADSAARMAACLVTLGADPGAELLNDLLDDGRAEAS